MAKKALQGDIQAGKIVMEYGLGKPKQHIGLEAEGGADELAREAQAFLAHLNGGMKSE